MRTLFQSCLLFSFLFLLNSCRTHGPAFYANADSYMAKPAYRGENQGAFYLSGRLNQGYEYYEGEKNVGGEFSAHLSYMGELFYASGGFYGFWGKYKVDTAISLVKGNVHQRFQGGGFRAELGGRVPLRGDFDLLLGVNGEMFREGGEYAQNSSDALLDVFTLGISRIHINMAPAADLRYIPVGKWDMGLRYSLDSYISVGDLYTDEQRTSLLHRVTLHATLNQATAFGQIGFTDDNQRVYSLGLAFGIPFGKKEKVENQ